MNPPTEITAAEVSETTPVAPTFESRLADEQALLNRLLPPQSPTVVPPPNKAVTETFFLTVNCLGPEGTIRQVIGVPTTDPNLVLVYEEDTQQYRLYFGPDVHRTLSEAVDEVKARQQARINELLLAQASLVDQPLTAFDADDYKNAYKARLQSLTAIIKELARVQGTTFNVASEGD